MLSQIICYIVVLKVLKCLPVDVYCKLLSNIHVVTTSGWIAVQRGVKIDFNPEQYSLVITTDSTLGSNNEVVVWFFTSQGFSAGDLYLYFTSTLQYQIWPCSSGRTNFPTNLPPDNDKVWRVTLTRTSGIRLVIHCNEEEVLNTMISDSWCVDSNWSTRWTREAAKIEFSSEYDTASDYYQTQPGSCVF